MIDSFRQDDDGLWMPIDPEAHKDFTLDWSRWLGDDRIVLSVWIVEEGLIASAPAASDTTATVWLTPNETSGVFRVRNRITTAEGRIDVRSFRLVIQEK